MRRRGFLKVLDAVVRAGRRPVLVTFQSQCTARPMRRAHARGWGVYDLGGDLHAFAERALGVEAAAICHEEPRASPAGSTKRFEPRRGVSRAKAPSTAWGCACTPGGMASRARAGKRLSHYSLFRSTHQFTACRIGASGPATLPTVTNQRRSVYLRGMNTLAANETTAPAPPPVQAATPTTKPASRSTGKDRTAATTRAAGKDRARSRPLAARFLAGLFGGRRHPDLLAKAASPATLAAAWSRVRRNAGVAGADGLSCRAFGHDARSRPARLRRDLLAGHYAPGPVRRVEIVKESGGTRPLAIPCVADRVVQTAVAFTLTPLLEPAMSSASFGYRPGLGVADAVARVVELRRDSRIWVLESDVARFFETVPHPPLLALLEARAGDPRLTELVASWLDGAGAGGCGLLQGSPLSPLLANLYLDEVDHLLDGPDGRLVRYADDCAPRRRGEEVTMH